MPNRYIDRYRQLKSARLKYKQSVNASKQTNISSFVNITKVNTTEPGETKYNSPSVLSVCEDTIISPQVASLGQ